MSIAQNLTTIYEDTAEMFQMFRPIVANVSQKIKEANGDVGDIRAAAIGGLQAVGDLILSHDFEERGVIPPKNRRRQK